MSQPTFKGSPLGLTEPLTIDSQVFFLFLPHLLLPLLGKLCWDVVLDFESSKRQTSQETTKGRSEAEDANQKM